jgi:hypothetical protein
MEFFVYVLKAIGLNGFYSEARQEVGTNYSGILNSTGTSNCKGNSCSDVITHLRSENRIIFNERIVKRVLRT